LLFVEASILPDLHRIAASRARIAVAADDDALLFDIACSSICPRNNASHHPSYFKKDERPHDASARKTKQSSGQAPHLFNAYAALCRNAFSRASNSE
jgi:hypothetical protein